VFRMEEKPALITKTVKSAAPGEDEPPQAEAYATKIRPVRRFLL